MSLVITGGVIRFIPITFPIPGPVAHLSAIAATGFGFYLLQFLPSVVRNYPFTFLTVLFPAAVSKIRVSLNIFIKLSLFGEIRFSNFLPGKVAATLSLSSFCKYMDLIVIITVQTKG